MQLYRSPSPASTQANEHTGHDAALLVALGGVPTATWVGDWTEDPVKYIDQVCTAASATGSLPVFVLYNAPMRDYTGGHSAGGASSYISYSRWLYECCRGFDYRAAIVILEPDALAGIPDLPPAAARRERHAMLRNAVAQLSEQPALRVYLDAGHPRWLAAEQTAGLLHAAGVERAWGFALNTSNYVGLDEVLAYGDDISEQLGGARYVVDTSRNGQGPAPDNEWCNPPGRGVGRRPGLFPGPENVDAYLWIKRPGESDGECHGGPPAGQWWPQQALELARNANPPLVRG